MLYSNAISRVSMFLRKIERVLFLVKSIETEDLVAPSAGRGCVGGEREDQVMFDVCIEIYMEKSHEFRE